MKLQQLRYLVAVVGYGSFNKASQALYVSQPTMSKAVEDLEHEMGITILARTNRGVTLTEEGTRFLSYARQVVEQADLLEEQYKGSAPTRRVFSISSQHYAFVVNAFVRLVQDVGRDRYEFSLREGRTADIIEDVRLGRSELGVIYLSHFNAEVMERVCRNAGLSFTDLFTATPHVFVGRNNPLAQRSSVTLDDLVPYPRLSYDQGERNSFYFAEELYSVAEAPKSIVVLDRATLFNLLIGLNGYTISSGVLSSDLNGTDIISVPLEGDEVMRIGYLQQAGRPLSLVAKRYIGHLRDYIAEYGEADPR
ncbi:MAG: LysR family transcriptional regulator [Olegusella sp.]|nr:LysR family transcriptional regulator [Olegusella sp.]